MAYKKEIKELKRTVAAQKKTIKNFKVPRAKENSKSSSIASLPASENSSILLQRDTSVSSQISCLPVSETSSVLLQKDTSVSSQISMSDSYSQTETSENSSAVAVVKTN